jgi:hypothetical protein
MPPMTEKPRKLLRCLQCGYSWFERQGLIKGGPPRQCPSCHSIRWHKRGPYDPHRPRQRRKRPTAEPRRPEGGAAP